MHQRGRLAAQPTAAGMVIPTSGDRTSKMKFTSSLILLGFGSVQYPSHMVKRGVLVFFCVKEHWHLGGLLVKLLFP